MPSFDREKFAELMLYIADRTLDDPSCGATKFNKILFFSDVLAYTDLGSAITGARYQRLPNGPAPRALLPVRDELIREGAASLAPTQPARFTPQRLVALREPKLDLFTAPEISLVDSVIELLRGVSNSRVSEFSHEMSVGWNVVEDREDIPYETAFLAPPDSLTEGDLEAAAAAEVEFLLAA